MSWRWPSWQYMVEINITSFLAVAIMPIWGLFTKTSLLPLAALLAVGLLLDHLSLRQQKLPQLERVGLTVLSQGLIVAGYLLGGALVWSLTLLEASS